MKRSTLWGVALVLVLGALGLLQLSWSQQITASITGTVEDAGGAAVNEPERIFRTGERNLWQLPSTGTRELGPKAQSRQR
jgi:hypothetical protein